MTFCLKMFTTRLISLENIQWWIVAQRNRKRSNNILSRSYKQFNRPIIGCATHIVQNAVETGADLLPVDIEGISTGRIEKIIRDVKNNVASSFTCNRKCRNYLNL